MKTPTHRQAAAPLQVAVLAFLALAGISLCVVYLIDPAIERGLGRAHAHAGEPIPSARDPERARRPRDGRPADGWRAPPLALGLLAHAGRLLPRPSSSFRWPCCNSPGLSTRLIRSGIAFFGPASPSWRPALGPGWSGRTATREPGARWEKEGAETGALRRTSREAVVRNRPRRHPGADSLPTRRGRNHGRP